MNVCRACRWWSYRSNTGLCSLLVLPNCGCAIRIILSRFVPYMICGCDVRIRSDDCTHLFTRIFGNLTSCCMRVLREYHYVADAVCSVAYNVWVTTAHVVRRCCPVLRELTVLIIEYMAVQRCCRQEVSLSSVEPVAGPRSGGTQLTFVGTNLDVVVERSVSVAGLPCAISR